MFSQEIGRLKLQAAEQHQSHAQELLDISSTMHNVSVGTDERVRQENTRVCSRGHATKDKQLAQLRSRFTQLEADTQSLRSEVAHYQRLHQHYIELVNEVRQFVAASKRNDVPVERSESKSCTTFTKCTHTDFFVRSIAAPRSCQHSTPELMPHMSSYHRQSSNCRHVQTTCQ